jgi:hypothetical protein
MKKRSDALAGDEASEASRIEEHSVETRINGQIMNIMIIYCHTPCSRFSSCNHVQGHTVPRGTSGNVNEMSAYAVRSVVYRSGLRTVWPLATSSSRGASIRSRPPS